MKKYKHVLVATNLTAENDKVVERAASIAKDCGAELSMLHVVQPEVLYGGGEFAVPVELELEDEIVEQAKKDLAKKAKRWNVKEKNQIIETGFTKESIIHLVGSRKIDLVVVGSHDHHGLLLLFGALADSILHVIPCDVLAVRLEK